MQMSRIAKVGLAAIAALSFLYIVLPRTTIDSALKSLRTVKAQNPAAEIAAQNDRTAENLKRLIGSLEKRKAPEQVIERYRERLKAMEKAP